MIKKLKIISNTKKYNVNLFTKLHQHLYHKWHQHLYHGNIHFAELPMNFFNTKNGLKFAADNATLSFVINLRNNFNEDF